MVVELLRTLRGDPQKLATALGGTALGVELVVESVGGGRFLLLLSPDGMVHRMQEEALRSGLFHPHITLRGRPQELLAVVFGEQDTAAAVFAGTLVLHVDRTTELLPHYPRVVRVVAQELARLLRR